MADAERREIIALVPRGQTRDCSVAFVLPDFFSDPQRFRVRQGDDSESLRRRNGGGHNTREGKGGENASAAFLSP